MTVRVVVDVEMCRVRTKGTGYPFKNEIIQIGAVMMDEAFAIKDKFSTFVSPRYGKIDRFIAGLTGITERTIKDAPDIEEALDRMLRWIGENEVIFYAWSDSDYRQIQREIEFKCQESERWTTLLSEENWVDYQKTMGDRLEYFRSIKLEEALELAEIDTEGHMHDGLDDAYNTALMISKLETQKDYQTIVERLREREKEQEPLTTSLGSLLAGVVLDE